MLITASREQLQSDLIQNCFTSVDLVKAYIARINEVNSTLRPVLEINPDALDIAQDEVEMRLHGIPVPIKDTIGTADKMQTTAGSYSLFGSTVSSDETVAKKLRDHGAIILGKMSMTEWMNFRSSNSSNGWTARGGQTSGAYYPLQDPNGSSSGSAVAVDLGLAVAALGTETMESILFPSEANNIVRIKPTVGLTSRYNVIPISERKDPNDNYTSAAPPLSPPKYVKACELSGLHGKRIGIPRNVLPFLAMLPYGPPILAAFEAAIPVLAKAGAVIKLATADTVKKVMHADFATNLRSYLSRLETTPNNILDIEGLRNYTQRDPREEYPAKFWAMYQNNLRIGGEGGVLGALSRHKLDALILPTAVSPYLPALVGTPVITVPLGAFPNGTKSIFNEFGNLVQVAENIPFGISFMGADWGEAPLIGMAYAIEQRTLAREKLKRYIELESEVQHRKDSEFPSPIIK
ncbi:amidase signature enzyme [Aspergillus leporis]|uniref:Amidase signature enzyme n=1 Tax=Aspergillus leporis TaxID=41062 RepID=A0A5N5XFE6_9EURO|nr:amidase signature enzyme [Aspergillus leporis]